MWFFCGSMMFSRGTETSGLCFNRGFFWDERQYQIIGIGVRWHAKVGHAQVCKLPGSTCRTTDFLSYVTNQTRPLPSVFGPFVKKNVGKVELIGCLPRVLTRRPVTLRCSKSHQVKTIQLNTYRGNKGYL